MKASHIVILLLAIPILLVLTSGVAAAAPVGYSNHLQHTITGSIDGAMSSGVMKLVIYNQTGSTWGKYLYVGAACQNDFDDIVINDSTDKVTFSRWIDWSHSGPNFITLYYNVSTGIPFEGTTINLYYGNPNATNSDSPSSVFTYFNTFSSSTGITTSGAVTVSGGDLSVKNGGYAYMGNFGNGNTMLAYGSISNFQGAGVIGYYGYTLVGFADAGLNNAATIGQHTTYANGVKGIVRNVNGGSGGDGSISTYSGDKLYEVCRGPASNRYTVDGIDVFTTSSYYTSATIPLMAYAYSAWDLNEYTVLHWVAVMKGTINPPTDSGWTSGAGTTVSDMVQPTRFALQSYLLSNNYPSVSVTVYDSDGEVYATGTTGSDGSASFMLYRSSYYTVRFVDEAHGVDATWSGYPWDADNPVWFWPSNWNPFGWIGGIAGSIGSYFGGNETTMDVTKGVGSAVSYGDLPGGAGYFAGMYDDHSASTTSVQYTLYKFNKASLTWDTADSATIAGSSSVKNFTIAGVSNNTYRLNMTGLGSVYGTVYRSAEHTWQPQWSLLGLGSWPAWATMYFALIIILGVAMVGTKRYELGIGVMLICVTFVCDMLNLMGDLVPHEVVFIMLTLMTIMVIVYAVAKWRREHGH